MLLGRPSSKRENLNSSKIGKFATYLYISRLSTNLCRSIVRQVPRAVSLQSRRIRCVKASKIVMSASRSSSSSSWNLSELLSSSSMYSYYYLLSNTSCLIDRCDDRPDAIPPCKAELSLLPGSFKLGTFALVLVLLRPPESITSVSIDIRIFASSISLWLALEI